MSTFFFGSVIDINTAVSVSAAGINPTASYSVPADNYAMVQVCAQYNGTGGFTVSVAGLVMYGLTVSASGNYTVPITLYVGPNQTISVSGSATVNVTLNITGVQLENNS